MSPYLNLLNNQNPNLTNYIMPTSLDMPEIEVDIVKNFDPTGPFGAKGLGESGTFGVSPAIANAIHDAIGVRLTELPLKPEAVLRAMQATDALQFSERRVTELSGGERSRVAPKMRLASSSSGWRPPSAAWRCW